MESLVLKMEIHFAYEINIFEEKGIVNGFSITDKGGKNETKSDISGIYNRNTKTYKLKETQVLSTKSELTLIYSVILTWK